MNGNPISEVYSNQAKELPGYIASVLGSMKALASNPGVDEKYLRRKVGLDYASELNMIRVTAENVVVYVRCLEIALAEKGGTK